MGNNRLEEVLSGNGKNYILPFFWQHGESEGVLRKYVHVIHDANIGAFCVESRPHPDFCGPKWWSDMDAIIDEAKKLGMKVWILDDSHFPTGYAAGAVENAPKELCHQYMNYRTLTVCGPKPQTDLYVEEFAHPEKLPAFMPQPPAPKRVFNDDSIYKVIASKIEPENRIGSSLDITPLVKDGFLRWDVPDGYWKIFVIYLTRDADGRNDYINLLDKDSCCLLLDAVYVPHYEHYKEYFGNVIAGFFSDEPPIGNTPGYTAGDIIGKPNQPLPWSAAVPAKMELEFGSEDWTLYLPMLWNDGADEQMKARIRVAYMDAVSKLVEESFSIQNGKWCEEHGVEYIGHMLEDCDMNANLGPSMGHFFRGLAGQHMSGIDNIGGQVMIGGQNVGRMGGSGCQDEAAFYHYELGKLGASLAAIDPKKDGRCMCENFGAYGWQCGVRLEKYLMDHFLVRGVNYYVPHAFSPAPFPDFDCPPHFYAHGQNPQYRAFGDLMAYSNRICHLISGGISKQDVAVLYHGESQWGGDYQSNLYAARELTQRQLDFHIIPSDIFEERAAFNTVFDGKILSVNGREYKALVISRCEYLYKAAAEFISTAVESDFPVIFIDNYPKGISNAAKEESELLLEKVRRGRTAAIAELHDTLCSLFEPDVRLDQTFRNLTIYHYKSEMDTYVMLNEDPSETFTGTVTVKARGEAAAYDAWENCLRPVSAQACESGTEIEIELKPLEMLIVVFSPEAFNNVKPALKPQGMAKVLTDFTVSRAAALAYPSFSGEEKIDMLSSMAAKYPDFSGYFCYTTHAAIPESRQTILEIGDVYDSAEVFVNGISAGCKVAQPYLYDITDLISAGENEIKIEAATTLERKVRSMGVDIYCMGAKAPLSPTGIIGNVTIYSSI